MALAAKLNALLGRARWMAVTAAIFLAGDLTRLFLPISDAAQNTFTDGFETVVAVLGIITAGVASRRSRRFASVGWALVAFFFVLLTIGDFHDFFVDVYPAGAAVFPSSLAFLVWFFTLPLALLIFLPSQHEERTPWDGQALLDVLQVTLVLAVAYFYFIYVPHYVANRGWSTHFSVEYVRNLILSVGLLTRAWIDPLPNARALYRRVAAAVIGASIFQMLTAAGFPNIADIGRPASLLLLVIFAAGWRGEEGDTLEGAPSRALPDWLLRLLPVLGPVAVLAMAQEVPQVFHRVALLVTWLSIMIFVARMAVSEYQRQRNARRLEVAETYFRQLFFNSPLPMWVFDLQSLQFLEVNDATLRLYGFSREEFLRMEATQLRPKEDIDLFLAGVRGPNYKPQMHLHRRHLTKDGRVLQMELETQSIEFAGKSAELVIGVDVTERKRLEEQLRQSQKMEAVGTLAGGVAHDFNNLLTVITGYAQLAMARGDDRTSLTRDLQQIEEAGRRAATLTRQLLAFTRQQILQPTTISLNSVVSGMQTMLLRLIGEHIVVNSQLSTELWLTKADRGQLEQVILNLAVNARDAMPKGGTLTFHTRNLTLDSLERGLRPGRYVVLTVGDTGMGMDEPTKAHIFEPFFTTKEPGRGTGLGLSTVYGIVQQSGGVIEVDSQPGEGSQFTLYLPAAEVKAAAAAAGDDSGKYRAAGGTETVLIVEDDESLRGLTVRILREAGYMVLAAGGAAEAKRVCREHVGAIDLLLSDVVMPVMPGPELAAALLGMRPRMRVMFVSGYTDNAVLHEQVLRQDVPFLQKPFRPSTLLAKVRETLDARDSKAAPAGKTS